MILSSDKSSDRNLPSFLDIKKPMRIEHLQSEEPFSSDPYFSDLVFGVDGAKLKTYSEIFQPLIFLINFFQAAKTSDPKTIKNQKMAAKVQLMKLKMKAQGQKSIPTDDKVFFGIKSQKKDMKPVFVSKKWSLGK